MRRKHFGLAYLLCEECQWQQTMAVSDVQTSQTVQQNSYIEYKLSAPIFIPFPSTSKLSTLWQPHQ